MTWAEAVPNLLIGLREGLEAGLVVSILLAAVRRTRTEGRGPSSAPVWLGVLGAVMVAASFASVLSFSTSLLSTASQEGIGGVLSVAAVSLVTVMVLWMRRAAMGLAGRLRGDVERAVEIGAGALAITAFLAVGREGLETTLFMWTAVKASGSTLAPLAGAATGLAIAVLVCWLLYRKAVVLNLGVFFARTAFALVVIAAGVLAYGLGDLQDAGWLPGAHWVAFDLTAHLDPNAWWMSVVTGVTELAPKMTMLQAVAWVAYLGGVIPAIIRAGRTTAPARAPEAAPVPDARPRSRRIAWERLVGRRLLVVSGALVVVPALVAGTVIVLLPQPHAAALTVTVTPTSCAQEWRSARTGTQTIEVHNTTSKAGEVDLVDSGDAVVAEIETIGPATTVPLTATLGRGTYSFACHMSGHGTMSSATVRATGAVLGIASTAVKPVTLRELTGPNDAYQRYAAGVLARLSSEVGLLDADLRRGDRRAAESDWLSAQLDWERVGASYDSFGDLGTAVDGLPDGLTRGVDDPAFTGLHRLEYGLWHAQSTSQLLAATATLSADVTRVRKRLTDDDLAGDPTNLPIRAHEILEDALRDHLSGLDDQGAGAAYPETDADVQVTRVVLDELAGPLRARNQGLITTAGTQLAALESSLMATRRGGNWRSPGQTPLAARQKVDAALGAVLETLDQVPDLLEVPPTH